MGRFIAIVGVILFCVIAGNVGYMIYNANKQHDERALERYTYEGTVTAIKYSESWNSTEVWLNSEPSIVEIQGDVKLVMGEGYEITVDGNDRLLNARIISGEGEDG